MMIAVKSAVSTVLAVSFIAVGSALAQADVDVDITGSATLVVGIVDGEADADADMRLGLSGSTILDNGLELGLSGNVRADGQQAPTAVAGGRYSSLTNGGTRGLGDDDQDLFLEGAYLFARGSFGSVHLGLDDGIASRLAVTAPTLFQSARINDWRTDLSGLNDVHTISDFSGHAPKITYMPPAGFLGGLIGQVQLGVSYAPKLAACDADLCAPVDGFATSADAAVLGEDRRWKDVVEAALYYQKALSSGADPLRLGVSASWLSADEEGEPGGTISSALLGDYHAYSLGVNLAYGQMVLGGSMKSTNASLNNDRDEDYLAFDAGVTYGLGEWNFMLGYGNANADRDAALLLGPPPPAVLTGRVDRETQTAQAGVSYVFDHGVTLGASAQLIESRKNDQLGGKEDSAAFLFESAIRF